MFQFLSNSILTLFRYENDIPPSSFTKDQLNEIRKVSLASVLCDNSDSIEFVQVTLSFMYLPSFLHIVF